MTKKWYEQRETGVPTYPRYHLTHYNGNKGYTAMVLSWDTETNTANGWVSLLERPTIKEARQALVKLHTAKMPLNRFRWGINCCKVQYYL